MINLLPPELKGTYHFARRNNKLARWAVACILSLMGGLVLAGGGYFYLDRSITAVNQQIDYTNEQLAAQNLPKVQKDVTDISNNLKLAVQVLSQEILFSQLLKQLANVTPSNTILTNVSIAQTQTGVDITAETTNYNAATQLQINLADPKNKIFSKADIVAIKCTGTTNPKYPCIATIRALFAEDNPFLFINQKANK